MFQSKICCYGSVTCTYISQFSQFTVIEQEHRNYNMFRQGITTILFLVCVCFFKHNIACKIMHNKKVCMCVCLVCRCVRADPSGGFEIQSTGRVGSGQRRTQNVRLCKLLNEIKCKMY